MNKTASQLLEALDRSLAPSSGLATSRQAAALEAQLVAKIGKEETNQLFCKAGIPSPCYRLVEVKRKVKILKLALAECGREAAANAIAKSISAHDEKVLRRQLGASTLTASTAAAPAPAPAPAPRFTRAQNLKIMREVFFECPSPVLSDADLAEDVSARLAADRLALPGDPASNKDGLTTKQRAFREAKQDRLNRLMREFSK